MVAPYRYADLFGRAAVLHYRYGHIIFRCLRVVNSDRKFDLLVDDAVFRDTLYNNPAVKFLALTGQKYVNGPG